MIAKQDFHEQIEDNKENQRIKSSMAPTQMSDTAARVAAVLGKEKLSPQPVLRGLVEETPTNKLLAYERCIKSLEDQIEAKTSKKSKAMERY